MFPDQEPGRRRLPLKIHPQNGSNFGVVLSLDQIAGRVPKNLEIISKSFSTN